MFHLLKAKKISLCKKVFAKRTYAILRKFIIAKVSRFSGFLLTQAFRGWELYFYIKPWLNNS